MFDIQQKVDWTILIYANGNNDLEPEMRKAMLDAEFVGSSSRVHVAIQIGRAEQNIVKMMRQDFNLNDRDDWNGVRRYYVQRGKSDLVEDLEYVNMADPKQFYSFVQWGLRSYPAKKYMLILGGHSYQCVGMMSDLSTDAPYIMGIPELVYAINTAANEMNEKIDILLLDTCCANSLELIYEFGKDERHAVQSVITYMVNGPIEGLPYDRIIRFVQAKSKVDHTVVTKDIINSLPCDLISFEIDHRKLHQIKQMFHEKAMEYRSKNMGKDQVNKITTLEQKNIIRAVSENSPPLNSYYKKRQKNTCSLIMVTAGVAHNLKLMTYYFRLGFSQDNYWASLVNNQSEDTYKIYTIQVEDLEPLPISSKEVYENISVMNPEIDEYAKREILKGIYDYKKWAL